MGAPGTRSEVPVLYATREGHTRDIAEHVAQRLRDRGFDARTLDLRERVTAPDLARCVAAVLAASVHRGHHEPEMLAFVRGHRDALTRLPTAFLSVTLSQAGVQRLDATPEEHARFVADVEKMRREFVADTKWEPARFVPVAGALRYSRYNFLVRILMKRIAREAGGSTDTTRDHDYTDWPALDAFVDGFADALGR